MIEEGLPTVNVNIIRFGEGFRHDRLRLLWDCYAELRRRRLRLHWHAAGSRSHAENLNLLWREEMKRPERYAIITEHDFLPSFNFFLPTHVLNHRTPIICSRYVTRDSDSRKLLRHELVGAWYMCIDKECLPDPCFDAGGPFNDPCGLLLDRLRQDAGPILLEPNDCLPAHYGVEYMTGTHLFWSRHLHDDPSTRISGCCLGDIQESHDRAVVAWTEEAPPSFRRVLARREKHAALSADAALPA